MNGTVLAVAGYTLLLSAFAALIYLLKMGRCKEILRNRLHILSTSDAFISLLTAVILLVNQPDVSASAEDTGNESTERQITVTPEDFTDANRTCMDFYLNRTGSYWNGENGWQARTSCTFGQVVIHYAMFLVPFVNTFISLLIFSMQCSKRVNDIMDKCRMMVKDSESEIQGTKEEKNTHMSGNSADISGELGPSRELQGHTDTRVHVDAEINIDRVKDTSAKLTSFGVIMQWLVPILVTGIVYLSKPQDMTKMHNSSEMECIFKVNFPMESCQEAGTFNNEFAVNSTLSSQNTGFTDNIINLDTIRISHPDSKEIDDVISSVRNVVSGVQLALNNRCTGFTQMLRYNDTKIWNITATYVKQDSVLATKDDDGTNKMEDNDCRIIINDQAYHVNPETGEIVRLDSSETNTRGTTTDQNVIPATPSSMAATTTESEQNISIPRINATASVIPVQDTNEESPFFTNDKYTEIGGQDSNNDTLLEKDTESTEIQEYNESHEIFSTANDEIAKNEDQETLSPISTEEIGFSRIDTASTDRQTTDEIYAEIVKRIRDSTSQTAARGKSTLVSSSKQMDGENNVSVARSKRSTGRPIEMENGCFLSTKFLKIHLLILLFVIYFIPILVSGILHTRAIYVCKNVIREIDTMNNKTIVSSANVAKSFGQRECAVEKVEQKSGWFSPKDDMVESEAADCLNSTKASQDITGMVMHNERRKSEEIFEATISAQKPEFDEYDNILQATENMQSLFAILFKSLLLSILMWTPAFLDILSKVFLCSATPSWLVNLLYVLGILFGVVRNFFNVNMAKINGNMIDGFYGKENSIRPST